MRLLQLRFHLVLLRICSINFDQQCLVAPDSHLSITESQGNLIANVSGGFVSVCCLECIGVGSKNFSDWNFKSVVIIYSREKPITMWRIHYYQERRSITKRRKKYVDLWVYWWRDSKHISKGIQKVIFISPKIQKGITSENPVIFRRAEQTILASSYLEIIMTSFWQWYHKNIIQCPFKLNVIHKNIDFINDLTKYNVTWQVRDHVIL